jgi:hypothetical protein
MKSHPMAWGAYMLRKPFVLVFIRFRVRARHHEIAAMKIATKTPRHKVKKNKIF